MVERSSDTGHFQYCALTLTRQSRRSNTISLWATVVRAPNHAGTGTGTGAQTGTHTQNPGSLAPSDCRFPEIQVGPPNSLSAPLSPSRSLPG